MDHIGKQYNGKYGNYKVTKHLASGGMGHVYEAIRQNDGLNVVIKFPTTHMPDGQLMAPSYHSQIVAKLKVESQILRNFVNNRPNSIVKYIDESTQPDSFFLVLEKVIGKTISRDISSSSVHLSEKEVIRRSIDILKGLEFLHTHNTIYRDMKPDNIMTTKDGCCVLIDFGAAKQGNTQINVNAGMNQATAIYTPTWTCPDQQSGKSSSECDLYALGRVMFFMATGITPKRFTNSVGRMTKTLHQIDPAISVKLSDLVNKLIDPEHNSINTAQELIKHLKVIHDPNNQILTPPSPSLSQPSPSLSPLNKQMGNRVVPQQTESRIVLQGKDYKISNKPGGSLIGKKHSESICVQANKGCNEYYQGRNIFVGWDCSAECRCNYNPAHMINKHHMRIWKDRSGHICVVNNDSSRRSAINRNNGWIPMKCNKKEVLKNHDQVALLYNEKKGPFLTFTFYVR